MQRQKFEETINANRDEVWKLMWSDDTYPQWTAPFSEGSRAETDWREGSRVIFTNAEGEGMVSVIHQKKEPEIMIFKHLGMRDKDGNEDYDSEIVRKWAGAEEIYNFKTVDGKTLVQVEMDIDEEYAEFFSNVWPEALGKVKELAENRT